MGRSRERSPTHRVTLADVARYAAVSSAVVSYVINNGPRPVAPATAERVRDAIAVLGYRPNSQARALSTGTTGILGLILPETGNPFFGEYNDVIHETAAGAGVGLLTASSGGRAETERTLIEDLARRNVDGLVVVSSMTTADVPSLRHPGLPILFLNCPFAVPGYRTFGPNGADGARRIVDHLLTVHHHQQVAFVAGETGSPEPEDREQGWREAHQVRRRPQGTLVRAAFTLDGGYAAARALLTRSSRPSAIFVSSDLQAYGVVHAIHEHDLRIPQDVAVVSFDGTSMSAHSWPPLTVVQQPLHAMARAAITNLRSDSPPGHSLFDMDLIIRQSCGCPWLP
jgi:LacI family transcriptional regulator